LKEERIKEKNCVSDVEIGKKIAVMENMLSRPNPATINYFTA